MRAAIPLLLAAAAVAAGTGAPPAAAGICCSKQAPPPPNQVQGNANNAAAPVQDLRQSQAAEVARRARAVRDNGREIGGGYQDPAALLDQAISVGAGTMLSDNNMAALRKAAAGTAAQADLALLIAQGITVIPTPAQMRAIEAAKKARERNQSLADFSPGQVQAFEDYERDNEAHGLDVNERLAQSQYRHDHPTGAGGNVYESTAAALAAHEYGRVQYFNHFAHGV